MKLTFYQQDAEPNRIDKRNWLKQKGSIENVMLLDETDLIHPIFLMQTKETIYNSNYCYSDFTKRYYFINKIEACTGGAVRIYCTVDVLFTYIDEITKSDAWIERSNKDDLMMHQDYPFEVDVTYKDYVFPESPFDYQPPDYTAVQCMLCITK